jgi:hypothetical protein
VGSRAQNTGHSMGAVPTGPTDLELLGGADVPFVQRPFYGILGLCRAQPQSEPSPKAANPICC